MLFEQHSGHKLKYLCKSSGLLAKGLRGGAIQADIYISASKHWMDFLVEEEVANPEQIVSPWGNELVVAVPRDSDLKMSEWPDLASDSVNTILIGDPGTAPFGRYAKQALQNTGLWEKVITKIVTKKHITLLADALSEADDKTVGILFVSNMTEKHRKLISVNAKWHTPIRYYVVPVGTTATKPATLELMKFLQESEVQRIFNAFGFSVYSN
jgi:molybdate transport system substrate-binding protein